MIIFIALIAALGGFGITWYIDTKQKAQKPLMCPRKAPCETVLSSPEAKTFGVSNTSLGLLFYAVIFFLVAYIGTGDSPVGAVTVLAILSTGGFLFSMYLVGIQHFKIKQWCVWCLGSAAMATILFVVSLILFF